MTSTPRQTDRSRRLNGDGSVFYEQHGDRWVALITDSDGKRHKRTAPTKHQAEKRLRELLNERDQHGRITRPNASFGDLMELWRSKKLDSETIAPATRKTKLWAYDRIHPELADVTLVRLTPDRVETALARLAEQDLGRESLIKIRSLLNQICRFGLRRDLIPKNPVTAVELPGGLPSSSDGRALTIEQSQHLLAVASTTRLHALWCALMMLGLRPGEGLGLHWSDIDEAQQVVHVRRALRQGESGFEITDQLKTSRSRRSIEMPDALSKALAERRTMQLSERERALEAWSDEWPDLVFTTAFGTPINPSNLRREFRTLTRSAGLGDWTPNELRHTAVSLLSAQGLPLERIADVVGHSGTRMTSKVYRHVITPSITHATASMNELFGPAAQHHVGEPK